ncbi:MAG: cyclodeaminase/cyclohydrolase family protein [Bacteroidota bacterium]
MSKPLADSTLVAFTAALASPEPTPGGGSASAAAVAMAAGLAGMVAGLSMGRASAITDERWRAVAEEAARLRDEALNLVDEDALAFDGVMAALRMPKGTEEEKAQRREALARANRLASLVPLRTAETGLAVLRLVLLAAEEGNLHAISDAGVAGEMALAGLRGAIMNVRINLLSLPDEEQQGLEDKLSPIEEEVGALADRIREKVQERL